MRAQACLRQDLHGRVDLDMGRVPTRDSVQLDVFDVQGGALRRSSLGRAQQTVQHRSRQAHWRADCARHLPRLQHRQRL